MSADYDEETDPMRVEQELQKYEMIDGIRVKDWDEDKHPRDHGKFTSGGGGDEGGSSGHSQGVSDNTVRGHEEYDRLTHALGQSSNDPENVARDAMHGEYGAGNLVTDLFIAHGGDPANPETPEGAAATAAAQDHLQRLLTEDSGAPAASDVRPSWAQSAEEERNDDPHARDSNGNLIDPSRWAEGGQDTTQTGYIGGYHSDADAINERGARLAAEQDAIDATRSPAQFGDSDFGPETTVGEPEVPEGMGPESTVGEPNYGDFSGGKQGLTDAIDQLGTQSGYDEAYDHMHKVTDAVQSYVDEHGGPGVIGYDSFSEGGSPYVEYRGNDEADSPMLLVDDTSEDGGAHLIDAYKEVLGEPNEGDFAKVKQSDLDNPDPEWIPKFENERKG